MNGSLNPLKGRRRHCSLGCILALALAVQANGETLRVVTPQSAVASAIAWHPSIVEAIGRLNARAETIAEAEAGYRPRINAGLRSGYDSAETVGWRPRASLSVSQMVWDFGKVSGAVSKAEAGTRMNEALLRLAADSLIRDTSFAVIEIQRDIALQAIAQEQLSSVSAIHELVNRRFQRGAATRSDALQALARVQSAQAAIQEIDAELQRWINNLNHLTGEAGSVMVAPDMPDWLMRSCGQGDPIWSDVPAIMQAQAARDEALADLDISRAEAMPTVSLGIEASTDASSPFSRRADYAFGFNVSSALYRGGANQARTRGATYALGAADAAEAKVRNEVSRSLGEAQRQVGSLDAAAVTLGAREQSMRETGKLYRLQYLEMGTRTLVDLLNAEQELHQVRFSLANTRHDIRRLQVECLFQSGAARKAFGVSGKFVGGFSL